MIVDITLLKFSKTERNYCQLIIFKNYILRHLLYSAQFTPQESLRGKGDKSFEMSILIKNMYI